jgi:hypothetical protein
MKYVRSFLQFWRKFIVGDDSRIAVVIMWAILFIYSLSLNFINAWFVLPVVVVGLMSALVYDASSRTKHQRIYTRQQSMLAGSIPMLLIIALPPVLSRLINDTWGAEYVLVPVALAIVYAVVLTIIVKLSLQKFPVLATFLLGVASYIFMTFWQSHMNEFAQSSIRQQPVVVILVAAGILLFFVVYVVASIRGLVTVRTGNSIR